MRHHAQISAFAHILRAYYPDIQPAQILDVGCGSGVEAISLQKYFGCHVSGIDVRNDFEAGSSPEVELLHYDGRHIPYPTDFFDMVYSFHVLEHVENVDALLRDIARVLKPGGVAFFGTPNKQRLVAYFGMQDKSLRAKIRQNVLDWSYRLKNQFENAAGAHAGFHEQELGTIAGAFFNKVIMVTRDYYVYKWPRRQVILSMLYRFRLFGYVLPSVYVICQNQILGAAI